MWVQDDFLAVVIAAGHKQSASWSFQWDIVSCKRLRCGSVEFHHGNELFKSLRCIDWRSPAFSKRRCNNRETSKPQMQQPRDFEAAKNFAISAHHRHDHRSHRRGTNGIPETCTPRTLAILLPPRHEEEPPYSQYWRWWTRTKWNLEVLNTCAMLLREDGHGLLTKVFDAKE